MGEIKPCTCGAQIEWITTPSGTKSPIEIEHKSGFTQDPSTKQWRHITIRESHFAHCPDADKHRKPPESKQSKKVDGKYPPIGMDEPMRFGKWGPPKSLTPAQIIHDEDDAQYLRYLIEKGYATFTDEVENEIGEK